MSAASENAGLPPILTLLTAAERQQVDAAGEGYYHAMHRDTVEDLIRDIKARQIQAVLISVSCANLYASRVASLVREFPRVSTVALLSDLEGKMPHAVLALGHCGIRRLIDVRSPTGWRELRAALMADAADNGQRSILGQLAIDLADVPNDCWRFFETLFTCSPRISSVRILARHFGIVPSTLMSRFFRARIPAPKQYLAMARLVRAARLFENAGFSISNVANHLDYSSPQSFSRHIRMQLEMSASDFRTRYDGRAMFARFRNELILPHLAGLRTLHPLTSSLGWAHISRDTEREIA